MRKKEYEKKEVWSEESMEGDHKRKRQANSGGKWLRVSGLGFKVGGKTDRRLALCVLLV